MKHDPSSPDAFVHKSRPSLFSWGSPKGKQISKMTLFLGCTAVLVELTILSFGFMYERSVCTPPGLAFTIFGVAPFGALLLTVEVLKLPLAAWSAYRKWWAKILLILLVLPLISLLTFELVKDMAVYELNTAMKPATEIHTQTEKAESRITALEKKFANQKDDKLDVESEVKKLQDAYAQTGNALRISYEAKMAALQARQVEGKKQQEALLAQIEADRAASITPTEYEKKEFAECDTRQASIVQQCTAEADLLAKAIVDLRARIEAAQARASKDSAEWEGRNKQYQESLAKWTNEEARINNEFQKATAAHTNQKNAYDKAKAEYDAASAVKRQFLREPVPPGVPPTRDVNAISKPAALEGRPSALVEEFDRQIKAKEDELASVNSKRRDRIAQVEADARNLRKEMERRASEKTTSCDKKRSDLLANYAIQQKQWDTDVAAQDKAWEDAKSHEKTIFDAALAKERASFTDKLGRDGIRKEIQKNQDIVEGLYQEEFEAIGKTQVSRLANSVEIARTAIFRKVPVSSNLSAKDKVKELRSQIDFVRLTVYPIFAFIVAILPTILVELCVLTRFCNPEHPQPLHRLGWFGRRLHALYIRAGRQKMARAERMTREAADVIAARGTQGHESSIPLARSIKNHPRRHWTLWSCCKNWPVFKNLIGRKLRMQHAREMASAQLKIDQERERFGLKIEELDAKLLQGEESARHQAQQTQEKFLEEKAKFEQELQVREHRFESQSATLKAQLLQVREAADRQGADFRSQVQALQDQSVREAKEQMDIRNQLMREQERMLREHIEKIGKVELEQSEERRRNVEVINKINTDASEHAIAIEREKFEAIKAAEENAVDKVQEATKIRFAIEARNAVLEEKNQHFKDAQILLDSIKKEEVAVSCRSAAEDARREYFERERGLLDNISALREEQTRTRAQYEAESRNEIQKFEIANVKLQSELGSAKALSAERERNLESQYKAELLQQQADILRTLAEERGQRIKFEETMRVTNLERDRTHQIALNEALGKVNQEQAQYKAQFLQRETDLQDKIKEGDARVNALQLELEAALRQAETLRELQQATLRRTVKDHIDSPAVEASESVASESPAV